MDFCYLCSCISCREHHQTNNSKDIGLLPGGRLRPQHLTLKELEEEASKNGNN